jgi:uncharacterized membrane protein YoaK (UPF0700 family)
MSMRAAAFSGLMTGALVLLVAWALEWPLERVVVLAPLLVVICGAVAGLVVLWTRIGVDSLRRQRHPGRIVLLALAAAALLVILSLLGVRLPRE